MKAPRKLTFQLTPLLDLLLIVIFAQYLDVKETSAQNEARLKTETQNVIEDQQKTKTASETEKQQLQQQIDKLQNTVQSLKQQHQKESTEAQAKIKDLLKQRKLVSDMVSELFQLPENLIDQILNSSPSESSIRSDQEQERLKQAIRDHGKKRGNEVIHHLLTYEELKKRCDIWEIYVTSTGQFQFSAGAETFEFRSKATDKFASEVFDRYKSLPQPKSLVIILLSYGDAQAGDRQIAIEGLRVAAEKMRQDSNGRSRFEYAILGFNPRETSKSKPKDSDSDK
jgi:hypothetical protein